LSFFPLHAAHRPLPSFPTRRSSDLNDSAVEIWGMNYPGFGGSTGPARLARIGPAAVAAFDVLRREAAGAPIVAYGASIGATAARSEEHTSELQSLTNLVCRLLL